VDTNNKLLKAI